MKKLLSFFLALMLVLSMFGCATQPVTTDPTTQATEPAGSVETTEPTSEPTSEPTAEPTSEPTSEPTTPPTEATQPPTQATQPPTQATEPPTQPPTQATQPPTEAPTEAPTEPQYTDAQLLVDEAFALSYGQTMSGTHTLNGTVSSVEKIGSNYATFTVRVEGTTGYKQLYVYKGTPANSGELTVKVGDQVTLTGTLKNYKGTIEFDSPSYVNHSYDPSYDEPDAIPTETVSGGSVTRDGIYDSKYDVARYLHTYGCLPSNFVTKSQYKSMGEPANKCCGGDRFYNNEGLLPNKSGRLYYECDIDTYGKTSRGAKRIVYSNDGLIFYTSDHYENFTQLYVTD